MEGNTGVRSRRELSTTDLAHEILKQHGQAMYYKDLISEILKYKDLGGENLGRAIAQVYSEINLDSRFHHKGQGQWALREWSYKGGRVVNLRPERPAPRPTRPPRLFEEEEELAGDPVSEEREQEEEGNIRSDAAEEAEEEWE